MAMIQVEHLTFSYPGSYDHIFEDVSIQFDTSWKLGFVGRNGRGKTTLLRLLQGQYEYSGSIRSPVRFLYFPYPVPDPTQLTGKVLEEVCPQAEEWELLRELSCMGIDSQALERPFQTLSLGEQTKMLLTALFLNQGCFPLIDEPTNHLDAQARRQVSAYLRRQQGFLLVSHDRRFLDGCVDHILSLNRTGPELVRGTFSSWLRDKEDRDKRESAQNEKLKGEIRRLEQSARQATAWSDQVERTKFGSRNAGLRPDRGFIGHKSAKMMKRAKNLEDRQQKAIQEKSALLKDRETAEALKLVPLSHYAATLAEFQQVIVSYAGRPVCGPVSFTVQQGARVALEGGNGSGKSSLLKLLMGEEIPHSGTVATASGLVISYVPQDASGISGQLRDFAKSNHIDESRFLAILRKMDFQRVQFEKDIREFSGGQKKKVLLAKSLCQQAHLYVWDEPLNFIDLYSRMQIEELLEKFAPTMVFVEHDSAFRERIATKIIAL